MFKRNIKIKQTVLLCGCLILLSGCATIDSFLGGGLNDPTNMDASEMQDANDSQMTATPVAPVEARQTTEDLLKEKDQALVAQGRRLAAARKELMAMQEEKSMLRQELDQAKKETAEKQALLDQQNNRQINNLAPTSNAPRMAARDGGYGLHLASYQRRDSIAPGLAAIERQIPVLIQGRPVKIANATVRGRTYFRLIVGQFNLQSEAVAECNQAKLLIDFCEVVAFEGEDF